MFQTFYQLREQPFGVNPDPRFLYLSRTHREAFSSLLYRIQMDSGFLAMIAQPGMGKTTLLFHLLHRLQGTAKTAFIFQTQCTSHELLRHLLSEFECDTSITDPVRMSRELKSLLLAEANAGRRCVVIVDEAQNLGPEVLETVRLLSNFETPRRKLLNIILSGQGELGEMLASADLRQLRQRMSCIVYLQRFTPGETALYIAHRLAIAGYRGKLPELFSLHALARIAQLSEGVPRVINNICFNALSLGYALEARQIDLAMIEEVAGDLGLSARPRFAPTKAATISTDPKVEQYPGDAAVDYRQEDSDALSAVTAACTRGEPEVGARGATEVPVEALEMAARDNVHETREGGLTPAGGAGRKRPVDVSEEVFTASGGANANSEPATRPLMDAVSCAGKKSADVSVLGAGQGRRRNSTGLLLVRGSLCLLILCIAPVIDLPARHSVSARSVEGVPVWTTSSAAPEKPISTPALQSRPAPRLNAKASPPGASEPAPHDTFQSNSQRQRRIPNRMRRSHQDRRMLVDLALASFAPEPLMELSPLHPMPLSARRMPNNTPNLYPPLPSGPASRWTVQRRNAASVYVPPRAIWQPAPIYPRIVRWMSSTDDVQLLLFISGNGEVYKVHALNGSRALIAAASQTVKAWKYSPALSNGSPVNSEVYVTVQFRQY